MDNSDMALVVRLIEDVEKLLAHPSLSYANPDLPKGLENNLTSLRDLGERLGSDGSLDDATRAALNGLDNELRDRKLELDSVATPAEMAELRRTYEESLAHVAHVRSQPGYRRVATLNPPLKDGLDMMERAALHALQGLDAIGGKGLLQKDVSKAILDCQTGLEMAREAYRRLKSTLAEPGEPEAPLLN